MHHARTADPANQYRYADDIAAAKALGCTSLRLSLEWARVMPDGLGAVDAEAVARYGQILDAMAVAGLEPMVTLHHFVHPAWFEELGGFAKEANIRCVVLIVAPSGGSGRLVPSL